jgi:hypothetical protein
MNGTILSEAERILALHHPDAFDSSVDAWPECIEFVGAVEESEAWRGRYSSLETFYAAHEARHPDMRLYAEARREIEASDPMTSPPSLPSQVLARLRVNPQP